MIIVLAIPNAQSPLIAVLYQINAIRLYNKETKIQNIIKQIFKQNNRSRSKINNRKSKIIKIKLIYFLKEIRITKATLIIIKLLAVS